MSQSGVYNVTESADHPSSTQTVIIVDDNQAITTALSLLLRTAGFEPIGCLCGQEALDASADATPAAAVIDIHLPDMNGLVLAQKLRARFGPETPIIIVSGDTSRETLGSLPHVGATYFFSKPVNPTALVEELKRLTRE